MTNSSASSRDMIRFEMSDGGLEETAAAAALLTGNSKGPGGSNSPPLAATLSPNRTRKPQVRTMSNASGSSGGSGNTSGSGRQQQQRRRRSTSRKISSGELSAATPSTVAESQASVEHHQQNGGTPQSYRSMNRRVYGDEAAAHVGMPATYSSPGGNNYTLPYRAASESFISSSGMMVPMSPCPQTRGYQHQHSPTNSQGTGSSGGSSARRRLMRRPKSQGMSSERMAALAKSPLGVSRANSSPPGTPTSASTNTTSNSNLIGGTTEPISPTKTKKKKKVPGSGVRRRSTGAAGIRAAQQQLQQEQSSEDVQRGQSSPSIEKGGRVPRRSSASQRQLRAGGPASPKPPPQRSVRGKRATMMNRRCASMSSIPDEYEAYYMKQHQEIMQRQQQMPQNPDRLSQSHGTAQHDGRAVSPPVSPVKRRTRPAQKARRQTSGGSKAQARAVAAAQQQQFPYNRGESVRLMEPPDISQAPYSRVEPVRLMEPPDITPPAMVEQLEPPRSPPRAASSGTAYRGAPPRFARRGSTGQMAAAPQPQRRHHQQQQQSSMRQQRSGSAAMVHRTSSLPQVSMNSLSGEMPTAYSAATSNSDYQQFYHAQYNAQQRYQQLQQQAHMVSSPPVDDRLYEQQDNHAYNHREQPSDAASVASETERIEDMDLLNYQYQTRVQQQQPQETHHPHPGVASRRMSLQEAGESSRLYEFARLGQWEYVAHECQMYPRNAKFVSPIDGTTALHLAVMSRTSPAAALQNIGDDGEGMDVGSYRPAPLELIEQLVAACPEAAIIRCGVKKYTPLCYACLVCDSEYDMDTAVEIVGTILDHAPQSVYVFTDEGFSPLDVHILSYSRVHKQRHEVFSGGTSKQRTSTVVFRELLKEAPFLANARTYGNKIRGPLELLYRCNLDEFKEAAELDDLEKQQQVAEATIPITEEQCNKSRLSVASVLSDWWAFKWAVLLLKACEDMKQDDSLSHEYVSQQQQQSAQSFSAVRAASRVLGCPIPILQLAISMYPEQVKERDVRNDLYNLPLHQVASWRCDQENVSGDPFVLRRKSRSLEILLQEYPEGARTTNNLGQTALQLAIEARTPWDAGLECLVKACPKALKFPRKIRRVLTDPSENSRAMNNAILSSSLHSDSGAGKQLSSPATEGMYPFLMAAIGARISKSQQQAKPFLFPDESPTDHAQQLERKNLESVRSIFGLLRARPDVLEQFRNDVRRQAQATRLSSDELNPELGFIARRQRVL